MNLLLITLVCALLFGGLSWLGRDDPNFECVEMGVWRPLICWISGTAISLVLWGLSPAQIVPLQLQYTSLRWIYWIGYILFILGLLYLIHAVFPVGWDELFVMVCILSLPVWIVSQFTNLYQLLFNNPLVIITAIVLLLLAGMLARHYSQKFLSEKSHSYTVFFLCCGLVLLLAFITIPYGLNLARVYQIPANLKNPIYPVTWRSILGMHAIIGIPESNFELYDSPLNQVWLVWYWRAGELFCVFISLSLLCLWYLKRQSRMIDGGFPSILQNRKRFLLHHAGLSLTKSCVISALIFSLIYLAVITAYLKPSEKLITKNYRKMNDKEVIRQETEALRAEIEADPKVMDRLRKQAEQSRKWFQEQPFPHETEDVL
jgi:positive regulator of sigma E activity